MFTTDQLAQNIRTGQWGTSSQLLNKTTDATANRANLRQKKTTWVPSRSFIYLWKMSKNLAWWFISLNMEVFHFERVNFNPHSITMSVGESPLYHLSLLYPTTSHQNIMKIPHNPIRFPYFHGQCPLLSSSMASSAAGATSSGRGNDTIFPDLGGYKR